MPLPVVSQEQLLRVHQALRITVPLESLSPVMLATLTHIAHCWGDRIPANLWPDDQLLQKTCARDRSYAAPQIDFKRRAAGDND